MKKIVIFVAAMVAFMAIVPASGQEKNFIDQSYIEVTGRAEMDIVPDQIYLTIVINEADSKGKKTIQQSEADMVSALRKLGIDVDKELSVSDMTSDLQTYLLRKNSTQTAKAYELKVVSGTQLGEVFKALSAAGISDASISRVDNSNMKELRNQVRVMAVTEAKQNAAQLAQALGQKTGRAIYIQDYGYSMRPFFNSVMQKSAMEYDSYQAPALDFQTTKIEQTVLVRFVLD